MKKMISVALALCLMFGCLLLPAAAAQNDDVICVRLHSDIAGCMSTDTDKLIEILSPQVKLYSDIHISNYAGASEYAHMDAGRQYYIVYTLDAAEGYELPETISDDQISIECGKGVSLISYKIVEIREAGTTLSEPTHRALRIYANVIVDGSAIQRLVGWIRDIILKIRSWQLY
ncbi:MAG: hypothetical protein IK118_00655 [Clostridia bacterium]|nr:hypothetical protein [Clostridia bacterium]MBR5426828.1 hypothetical protein [Clostridia bacterium]